MKKLALVMAVLMIFTCTSALADFHETNLPITDEKYEFSMMIDDSGYPEDKIIYNMLEEQTNVHVNLNLAPYALQVEKLGIALNTGDYADVIAGWLLGTKDIIDLGMGDQTFLPLEDLIAKYAPNIEEVLKIVLLHRAADFDLKDFILLMNDPWKLLREKAADLADTWIDDAVRCYQTIPCSAVNMPKIMLNTPIAAAMRNAGIPLSVWTVNEPELIRVCLTEDVSNITTRYIRRALRIRNAAASYNELKAKI